MAINTWERVKEDPGYMQEVPSESLVNTTRERVIGWYDDDDGDDDDLETLQCSDNEDCSARFCSVSRHQHAHEHPHHVRTGRGQSQHLLEENIQLSKTATMLSSLI